MNGLMNASVSLGSSHFAASVTWSPHVSVPSRAAAAGAARARVDSTASSAIRRRAARGLMVRAYYRGYGSRSAKPRQVGSDRQCVASDPASRCGRVPLMSARLGVDVGGTFTDVALWDESAGRLTTFKLPSVPADPAEGILAGIRLILARDGVAPAAVAFVAHGTTVATNALLEKKGARTALVTTRGFRDLLEIARQ